jgi:hypothetical protein
MFWEDLLRTLGGMAILVSAIAWLSRSLLTNLLSKDLEKFKSDLQIESQRHAVEYSALHAKRAELISDLYVQAVNLYAGILGLSRELGAREARAGR